MSLKRITFVLPWDIIECSTCLHNIWSLELGWGPSIQHSCRYYELKLAEELMKQINGQLLICSMRLSELIFHIHGAHGEFVTNVTDDTRVCVRTLPNAQQNQGVQYFDSSNTLSSKQKLALLSYQVCLFSCSGQLNRWPFQSLSDNDTDNDNVTLWQCDNVTMWHCDTVTLWQCK